MLYLLIFLYSVYASSAPISIEEKDQDEGSDVTENHKLDPTGKRIPFPKCTWDKLPGCPQIISIKIAVIIDYGFVSRIEDWNDANYGKLTPQSVLDKLLKNANAIFSDQMNILFTLEKDFPFIANIKDKNSIPLGVLQDYNWLWTKPIEASEEDKKKGLKYCIGDGHTKIQHRENAFATWISEYKKRYKKEIPMDWTFILLTGCDFFKPEITDQTSTKNENKSLRRLNVSDTESNNIVPEPFQIPDRGAVGVANPERVCKNLGLILAEKGEDLRGQQVQEKNGKKYVERETNIMIVQWLDQIEIMKLVFVHELGHILGAHHPYIEKNKSEWGFEDNTIIEQEFGIMTFGNGTWPGTCQGSNPKCRTVLNKKDCEDSSYRCKWSDHANVQQFHSMHEMSMCSTIQKNIVKLFNQKSCYTVQCPAECTAEKLSNRKCDQACNVPECNWDNGDCEKCNQKSAIGCFANQLGDGFCDEFCSTEECGFDNGDCLCGPPEVKNGIYDCDKKSYGEECKITCAEGYNINHTMPLICQSNRNWKSEGGDVKCKKPTPLGFTRVGPDDNSKCQTPEGVDPQNLDYKEVGSDCAGECLGNRKCQGFADHTDGCFLYLEKLDTKKAARTFPNEGWKGCVVKNATLENSFTSRLVPTLILYLI